mmetsp:Transcript_27933/g.56243  ORF Transcript_27933/g.56243 Transcript_27933/m.56243 type:complete len:82 (-) Transcript_27933:131-376(-)
MLWGKPMKWDSAAPTHTRPHSVRFAPLHAGVHFDLAREWGRFACLILPSACPHDGVCAPSDLPNRSRTVATVVPWPESLVA